MSYGRVPEERVPEYTTKQWYSYRDCLARWCRNESLIQYDLAMNYKLASRVCLKPYSVFGDLYWEKNTNYVLLCIISSTGCRWFAPDRGEILSLVFIRTPAYRPVSSSLLWPEHWRLNQSYKRSVKADIAIIQFRAYAEGRKEVASFFIRHDRTPRLCAQRLHPHRPVPRRPVHVDRRTPRGGGPLPLRGAIDHSLRLAGGGQ